MKVEVRLFANLGKLLPSKPKNNKTTVIIRKGSTVDQLLAKLKIPSDMTNVIMINGHQSDKNTVLNEGDTISIYPPIAGG